MSVLNSLHALVEEAVEVASVDMSETGTGGGGAQKVLETGMYPARLVEYIEIGRQKNEFDSAKAPTDQAELRFAVWELIDGTMQGPYFVNSYARTISNHERSGLKQFFDKMNWRRDVTKKHVAQFLGADLFLKVDKKKNKSGKEYNQADITELTPPRDPMSGQVYVFPELEDSVYRLFLFDKPTQETWDSIYIDGTRDDGTSKNFIQEKIMQAVNFPGSALEQMLLGGSGIPAPALDAVPDTPAETDVPWVQDEQPAEAAAPAAPVAPAVPAVPAAPAVPVAPAVPAVPNVPVIPTQGE